jgi:hypothetical protein
VLMDIKKKFLRAYSSIKLVLVFFSMENNGLLSL